MKNSYIISLCIGMSAIFSWQASNNMFVGLAVAAALTTIIAAISNIEKK